MFPSVARLRLLLCLALAWQVVAARHIDLVGRQDDAPATTDSGANTADSKETATATESQSASRTGQSTAADKTASATGDSENPTKTATEEATSSVVITTDGPLDTSSFHNGMFPYPLVSIHVHDITINTQSSTVTIPEGELPLKPVVTPGWGVAGAALLIAGGIFTLVGIRNRTVHTFLSTACATALGITVLIVYVMDVPVKLAVQGGYVAAVILSGCALGTASIFFKELTECLACALGGFCLSMWLLCLSPGGLLHTVSSKAIFIACFTVVGLAFYFSRFTRDWTLILTISFSGATTVVLGIDCFSRAGLKEFWAYIWHLNQDLFPLGADTYPVTKGIRVEQAAIIIIFIIGIISQIKLWKVIREKRAAHAAAREQDQLDLEQQEADIGRQVEDVNMRDRKEWERVYGDGEPHSSTDGSRPTSSDGVGSSGEKGFARHLSSTSGPDNGVVEICDASVSDRVMSNEDPLTEKDENGKVTIRVAQDELPEAGDAADGDHEAHPDRKPDTTGGETPKVQDSPAMSNPESLHQNTGIDSAPANKVNEERAPVSKAPAVVPLPFTVPHPQDDDDSHSKGDRSSVATFATDDDAKDAPRLPVHQDSFVKRFSHGSGKILRSLSQRSHRSNGGHRRSGSFQHGESSEELVMAAEEERNDARSSMAATFDDQSSDGDVASIASSRRLSLAGDAERDGGGKAPEDKTTTRELSPAETKDKAAETDGHDNGNGTEKPRFVDAEEIPSKESSIKNKSESSKASTPVSLTKGHLPPSLSRVALSYRTNEWAKHLSYADAPEPEDVNVSRAIEMSPPLKSKAREEQPAPVDVDDLQRSAENGGVPPISIPRSDSRTSVVSVAKRNSWKKSPTSPTFHHSPTAATTFDREQALAALSGHPAPTSSGSPHAVTRSPSATALRRSSTFEPIAEERGGSDGPAPIPEDDEAASQLNITPQQRQSPEDNDNCRQSVPGIVSFSSPQTLIGQREMFLRSKSQGNLLNSPPPQAEPTMRGAGGDENVTDLDDMPLSQRRQLMQQRNSSVTSMGPQRRSFSGHDLYAHQNASSSREDQVLPGPSRRNSSVPTPAVREARLAHFRNSVAMDLRSGTPVMPHSGRESTTPFGSTTSLVAPPGQQDVQRSIQASRSALLSQREAETYRRESRLRDRQLAERQFDERMRSGELLDAHNQAIRRLQQTAKRE